jgi:sigma-E factor negative regulatory protein RseA
MDTQRAMQISALIDGEVEEHEAADAIRASLDDAERWRLYWLIGESLRHETAPLANLTEAVMARLEEEPVVLAPRRLRAERPRLHPLWALAASVAGVLVVGWVAMSGAPQPLEPPAKLAAAPRELPGAALVARPAPEAPRKVGAGETAGVPQAPDEMHEYLMAHQAQAATVRLAESTRQIRTVALTIAQP